MVEIARQPPPQHSKQRPWAAIAAATCLNLPLGSLYAFSVFLKPMEQALNVTRTELSFVFALATISFTLGMNMAPRLFKLASPPVLISACAVLSALGLGLAGYASSLIELVIGYGILFGIGGGIAYILVQQGINLMVTRHRGLANGYVVALYPMGAMVAAPLFGWALLRWDLRTTLFGLAATVALTGGLTVLLSLVAGLRLVGASAPAAAAPPSGRTAIFIKMWLVFFLAAAAGLTVLSQAAGMVVAYGSSRATAVFATTAITGAIAAARLSGGWLTDRFAVPHVMAGAQGFALVGAVALTLFPSPETAVVALAMVGMGYGFISGATAGGIAFYWPGADYGRIASRLYIAWCVAAISLPVLAGYLFDLTGGYATAILIAGCGNLAGIVVALTLPRQVR